MNLSRRGFLKVASAAGGAGLCALPGAAKAQQPPGESESSMLVDTTLCVGCRGCEAACAEANQQPEPLPGRPVPSAVRNTTAHSLTVVNAFAAPDGSERYVKRQCMHCVEPACASACPVQALEKQPSGPVMYHPERCMGCRYCMVACPFEVPKYEYEKAVPTVKKCTFCFARQQKGLQPACVSACPSGALTFGKRGDLLEEANRRIWADPKNYVHHVYGELEAGGTNWLYLANLDFKDLGMKVSVNDASYPQLVKGALGVPPFVMTLWPPLLMGIYAFSHRKDDVATEGAAKKEERHE